MVIYGRADGMPSFHHSMTEHVGNDRSVDFIFSSSMALHVGAGRKEYYMYYALKHAKYETEGNLFCKGVV
jgi:hypothetical protein